MSIQTSLSELYRYLNILAQTTGFSAARFQVLKLIKENNPITLRQLAEIQQVSMPTLSKLVDELQNNALVIRAQAKDDARQRWIVPTQKGIQVLQEESQKNDFFWQKRLTKLTEMEKQQLEKSLNQLTEILKPKDS